jgi:thiol:disulfide interchange protein
MSFNSSDPSQSSAGPSMALKVRNLLIVTVAVVLSIVMVLGIRTQTTQVTLSTLATSATPLEVAQTNGKPTLMEFYANWCTSCQAMVNDIHQLEQQYGDRINFVMLNVDNTKWLPEILRYQVDGIPHFVFLSGQMEAQAMAVGVQSRSLMDQNLNALIAGAPIAGSAAQGETSAFSAPVKPNADDPRSHGGMPAA